MWNVLNLKNTKNVFHGGPCIAFRQKKSPTSIKRRKLTNDNSAEIHITEICLEDSLFKFDVIDSFRDSVCCECGNGGHVASLNDFLVMSGGEFDFKEKGKFN